MKKISTSKLALNRETLVSLTPDSLENVAGGNAVIPTRSRLTPLCPEKTTDYLSRILPVCPTRPQAK